MKVCYCYYHQQYLDDFKLQPTLHKAIIIGKQPNSRLHSCNIFCESDSLPSMTGLNAGNAATQVQQLTTEKLIFLKQKKKQQSNAS